MFTAAFRTDASTCIGTGHVMRCLTLADGLRRVGATCRFICRAHKGNLIGFLRERGYDVSVLPVGSDLPPAAAAGSYASWLGASCEEDARQSIAALQGSPTQCLVVDHYALDAVWERRLRPHLGSVFVIDDLANRRHDCDLLLDQNLGATEHAYSNLVPAGCEVLAGSRYALLRPEFASLRDASLHRLRGSGIRQLLVALGGVDKDNVTGALLRLLPHSSLPSNCRVVVAMGPQAPWLQDVRQAAAALSHDTDVQVGTTKMAELMAGSDLAIGAAGTMALERCAMGLPTLTVVLADNQRSGAEALARAGACRTLPLPVTVRGIEEALAQVSASNVLLRMQEAAAAVTDGLGTERVLAGLRRRYASL